MTILGIRPAQAPGTPDRENLPRGRALERILAAELLESFRHYAQTQTEFIERLAGQITNNVLETFTAVFPAGPELPYVARAYHVPCGAVVVNNLSGANTVTVTGDGPGQAAPGSGQGIYKVGPNTCRTVALASTQVTLWGTAGDIVSVQVFTAAARPAAGG